MTSLSELARALPARPSAAELLAQFVPPSRFRNKRFSNYQPDPEHPSQVHAALRLEALARELQASPAGVWGRLRTAFGAPTQGRGVYLDGGFGVGKTHLLMALWHAAPEPKSFLSFDELVYAVGLLGVEGTREVFSTHRMVAVDEWELDDPGNLRLALAWLRGALADGALVAVTSNTIPDQLGRGRFSQKDFGTEIAELASAFERLSIAGPDFRHRRFGADAPVPIVPTIATLAALAGEAGTGAVLVAWPELLETLHGVHPVHYAALAERIGVLLVDGLPHLDSVPEALRWVHFVDKLYDEDVPLAVRAEVPLAGLFPEEFFGGGYAKKFGRCLSRMQELLHEGPAAALTAQSQAG